MLSKSHVIDARLCQIDLYVVTKGFISFPVEEEIEQPLSMN